MSIFFQFLEVVASAPARLSVLNKIEPHIHELLNRVNAIKSLQDIAFLAINFPVADKNGEGVHETRVAGGVLVYCHLSDQLVRLLLRWVGKSAFNWQSDPQVFLWINPVIPRLHRRRVVFSLPTHVNLDIHPFLARINNLYC